MTELGTVQINSTYCLNRSYIHNCFQRRDLAIPLMVATSATIICSVVFAACSALLLSHIILLNEGNNAAG